MIILMIMKMLRRIEGKSRRIKRIRKGRRRVINRK
jgi:hypothetical protein